MHAWSPQHPTKCSAEEFGWFVPSVKVKLAKFQLHISSAYTLQK